jgi:hypothetical protein
MAPLTRNEISNILHGKRPANFENKDLTGAELNNADLRDALMKNANLTNAKLVKADLRGAHLAGAKFHGADLTTADLRTDLTGLDFTNAKLIKVFVGNNKMVRANLTGADLTGAELWQTDFTGAKVTDEQLAKAKSTMNAILPHGKQAPLYQSIKYHKAWVDAKKPLDNKLFTEHLGDKLDELEKLYGQVAKASVKSRPALIAKHKALADEIEAIVKRYRQIVNNNGNNKQALRVLQLIDGDGYEAKAMLVLMRHDMKEAF